MDLSLAIITRNEELCIARCIQSVPYASEVIVVDSGSGDRTVEIAEGLGARVFHHDFEGFSRQKMKAVELASCEWVLSLDADEFLDCDLAVEMAALLEGGPRRNGYTLPFRVLYMKRLMRFGPWSGERHLRLFRKGSVRIEGTRVHESFELAEGTPGRLRTGHVVHESYRSLKDQLDRMTLYAGLWAEEARAAGRGSGYFSMAFRPLWRFLSAFFLRGGLLEGVPGLCASVISSFYVHMKWARLYEMERMEDPDAAETDLH